MPGQQTDTIEELQGALIQHGPLSDRVYLMKLGQAEPGPVAAAIRRLAEEKDYSKIFAKVPEPQAAPFLEKGFEQEALIPGFYRGETAAAFLAYYLKTVRKEPDSPSTLRKKLFTSLLRGADGGELPALADGLALRACTPEDTGVMAALYRKVFPSYPFPIFDAGYLQETMAEHIRYFGIFDGGTPVALSSAEIDAAAESAEMTDFATLPDRRGQGLARHLLQAMERSVIKGNVRTAYTICRAVSSGINTVFILTAYTYAGRLINNTNIGGQIESMNVWYKHLDKAAG